MNKKQLYERIMRSVSQEVKRTLNEALEDFDERSEEDDDDAYNRMQRIKNTAKSGMDWSMKDVANNDIDWSMKDIARLGSKTCARPQSGVGQSLSDVYDSLKNLEADIDNGHMTPQNIMDRIKRIARSIRG